MTQPKYIIRRFAHAVCEDEFVACIESERVRERVRESERE